MQSKGDWVMGDFPLQSPLLSMCSILLCRHIDVNHRTHGTRNAFWTRRKRVKNILFGPMNSGEIASYLVLLWGEQEGKNDSRIWSKELCYSVSLGSHKKRTKRLQAAAEGVKEIKRGTKTGLLGVWCGSGEKMRHIFQVGKLMYLKGFKFAWFLQLHPGEGLSFESSQLKPEQCWGFAPQNRLGTPTT